MNTHKYIHTCTTHTYYSYYSQILLIHTTHTYHSLIPTNTTRGVQLILERIIMRTMPMPKRDFIYVTFLIESGGEVIYDHAKAKGLFKCEKYAVDTYLCAHICMQVRCRHIFVCKYTVDTYSYASTL